MRSYQLYIGLAAEGSTDRRLLAEIIQKTFIEAACGCVRDVVIEDVYEVRPARGSFVESMLDAARIAAEQGIGVLCVHADADAGSHEPVMQRKITPLLDALAPCAEAAYCKTVVPIVPVQMTEAWMLADISLLLHRIGAASVSLKDLNLDRPPESYADPKEAIRYALTVAQASRTKRRRRALTLDDLYAEMGQLLELRMLRTIPSFVRFEAAVHHAMRQLGLMS